MPSFMLKFRKKAWAAGPRWGSLQHSPNLLAHLRALLLEGREGREWEEKWYLHFLGGKLRPCPLTYLRNQKHGPRNVRCL